MRRLPLVTAALIVANLAVFFAFQHGTFGAGVPRDIEYRCNAAEYGLVPYEVTHPGERTWDPYCQPHAEGGTAAEERGHEHARSDPGLFADAPTWLTVATSMFMHGGLLHLGAGLLALAAFGPALERRLGPGRLLALYLVAGVATTGALVALSPSLPIPTILGSSGAAAALVAAVAPRTRLTPMEVPAWLLAAVVALAYARVVTLDAAQPAAGAGGDVVYLAPLAGLACGLLASRAPARARARARRRRRRRRSRSSSAPHAPRA